MTGFDIAALCAAIVSASMGVLGILAPRRALKLVGLQLDPEARHAISEVRATFGGLFLAMSVAAIVLDAPLAYAAVGAGWLGAGVVRLGSIILERIATPQNFGATLFESGLGALLLLKLLA